MATPKTARAKSARTSPKLEAAPAVTPDAVEATTGTAAQRIKALTELTAKNPPLAASLAASLLASPERSWKLRAVAAGALSGAESPEVFAAIGVALQDPEQGVRDAALGALSRSAHPDATELLLAQFNAGVSGDRSNVGRPFSMYTLYQCIGARRDPAIEAFLIARVQANPPDAGCIDALAWSQDPALLARLVTLVEDRVAGPSARRALMHRGGPLAYDALGPLLEPSRVHTPEERERAADLILSLWCNNDRTSTDGSALVNDPRWAELALHWLADKEDKIAKGAGILVKQLRHPRLVPAILDYLGLCLRSETPRTRATAELVQALCELRDPRATTTLVAIAGAAHAGESAQYHAVSALGALGDPATLPALYALKAEAPDDKHLREVIRAIERGAQ